MNHPMGSKIGWVTLPPYVEYPTSDKRNRNPNWTDSEITRFLSILMEKPVLHDLNAQRNKQVFCYVSTKMAGEGCEKSWDQCRVKLKNLKSQWRYVKDRIPGIESADLDDEEVVRTLGQECQSRGVSPSCIKHLRLLKQFLVSLTAVRRGVSPPKFKLETFNVASILENQRYPPANSNSATPPPPPPMTSFAPQSKLKMEKNEEEDAEDLTDARLVVETGISPPTSPDDGTGQDRVMLFGEDPDNEDEEEEPDHIVVDGENPLDNVSETTSVNNLRVKSPHHININNKRSLESNEAGVASKRPAPGDVSDTVGIIQRFQREMVEKFLAAQRESEVRQLAWEQERWRLEQAMMDKVRAERRSHDKEMFSMFCSLVSETSSALLEHTRSQQS